MTVAHGPLLDSEVAQRLYERSAAARWGLSTEDFANTLQESLARGLTMKAPSAADVERYLGALHLEDLAIAAACARGHEPAWEHVMREHRAGLTRAAEAIDPSGAAREIADGIYSELFGLKTRDGERSSLFRYFDGRSSLATWLRAVLSQRFVDHVRAKRKLVPLPEHDAPLERTRSGARDAAPADPERARFVDAMRRALERAVARLAPRDRLRLAWYYTHQMKLGAIGKLLGEHEATVSRHLTRVRSEIKAAIEETLRRDHGFDDGAVTECVRVAMDDPGAIDLTKFAIATELVPGGGKNPGQDRSR
jgi:RNA polymerase sigma-70 factor (ECF subfamily)